MSECICVKSELKKCKDVMLSNNIIIFARDY